MANGLKKLIKKARKQIKCKQIKSNQKRFEKRLGVEGLEERIAP